MLLAGGVVLLAIVLTARPGDPALYPPKAGDAGVPVYLIHNGYHAELALPSDLMRRTGGASASALRRLPASPWVMVGWGDARFYIERGWSVARVLDGLRAGLKPGNPSALRLTPLARAPDQTFGRDRLRLELSGEGARRMLRRLDGSFRLQAGEPIEIVSREDHGAARHFQSVEGFGLVRLCNNWTGDLVAAAGLPTTPALHLTPQGLMLDLRWRRGRGAETASGARRS